MIETFSMSGNCVKDHDGCAMVVVAHSAGGDLGRKIRHDSSDYTADPWVLPQAANALAKKHAHSDDENNRPD